MTGAANFCPEEDDPRHAQTIGYRDHASAPEARATHPRAGGTERHGGWGVGQRYAATWVVMWASCAARGTATRTGRGRGGGLL